MPGNKVNIKGTSGKTYNLDELFGSSTRSSSTESLVVQIWKWNPNLPASNPHSKPNPSNLVVGQIWLSVLIDQGSSDYEDLLELTEEE